jgi:hypothetical protein
MSNHRTLLLVALALLAPAPALASPDPAPDPLAPGEPAADPLPPTEPTPQLAAALAAPPPEVAPGELARMRRARFSGKRFVVESLGGGLAGGLASYAVFRALCPEGGCMGGAIAAMTANMAVTPLGVWGIGKAMGGQGSLLSSYYGLAVAGVALHDQGSPDETPAETIERIDLQLTIFTIALPFASALCYEVSSHLNWSRWYREHQGSLSVTPIGGAGSPSGAVASMAFRF